MTETARPAWLEFPGSHVSLLLRPGRRRTELAVLGNSQGLGSFASALLWLTAYSDASALSLTGLPFVRAQGPLALAVVMTYGESKHQGRLRRRDKDMQFEWQIDDEALREVAYALFRVAVLDSSGEYFEPSVDPASDLGVIFEVT